MNKPIDLKELEGDDEATEKTAQAVEQQGNDPAEPVAAEFPVSGSKAWN